jgi:hypothetical protein
MSPFCKPGSDLSALQKLRTALSICIVCTSLRGADMRLAPIFSVEVEIRDEQN